VQHLSLPLVDRCARSRIAIGSEFIASRHCLMSRGSRSKSPNYLRTRIVIVGPLRKTTKERQSLRCVAKVGKSGGEDLPIRHMLCNLLILPTLPAWRAAPKGVCSGTKVAQIAGRNCSIKNVFSLYEAIRSDLALLPRIDLKR